MTFDKTTLSAEQLESYDKLVARLKSAKSSADQQAARVLAMIPGAGDLQNVAGALAAADHEAGVWLTAEQLVAHTKAVGTVAGDVRYDPLSLFGKGGDASR